MIKSFFILTKVSLASFRYPFPGHAAAQAGSSCSAPPESLQALPQNCS